MTIVIASAGTTASATDVPSKFDVIIDGHGYKFLVREDPRARYTFSPTFVPRSNIQGDYGDNQQEFFLTATQRDWSLGEQQKFSKTNADSQRRYWQGTNIDVSIPGQVSIRQAVKSVTYAAAVKAACPRGQGSSQNLIAASTSNLYEIDPAGAITDRTAHGLGAAPSKFGIATDGANVYVSTSSAGTVGVRKWTGSAYSTWSATPADSLEFLNNALYGLRADTAELNVYSTGGVATQKFQWKDASGTARTGNPARIKAFGGQLLILWSDGPAGPELWTFDGQGCRIIAQFPKNFYAYDLEVVFGQVFVGGSTIRISNGNTAQFIGRPAVYFYAQGAVGKLWESNVEAAAVSSVGTAGHPSIAAYGSGMIFNDDTRGELMFYEATTGGVHSIGSYTVAGDTPILAASQRAVLHIRDQAAAYLYPDTTTIATSGTIESSLVDFQSSLSKFFKSISVDADIPSGASIDISYQLNANDSLYTSVVTGAAAGTEYNIEQNARSLAYKITLNKGSASTSPTLKRVYLRGAPLQNTFVMREYLLDLSGRDGKNMIRWNDGSPHNKDGKTMAGELITSAEMSSPINFTDIFGTFSGIIQPDQFEIDETRPEEYVARVRVRGI